MLPLTKNSEVEIPIGKLPKGKFSMPKKPDLLA